MDKEWERRQRVIAGEPEPPTLGLPVGQQVPADFYDEAYFTTGEKSNYAPYGKGEWTDWLADMVIEKLSPRDVLDVGCATGVLAKAIRDRGIRARGFDISGWAVDHAVIDEVWQGSAADPAAYRNQHVDLITSTELPEHLVEDEARAFLHNASQHGQRLLLLGVFGVDESEHAVGDHSHIGVRPIEWWVEEARVLGWILDAATSAAFNEDDRSTKMQWNGRFLVFSARSKSAPPSPRARTPRPSSALKTDPGSSGIHA